MKKYCIAICIAIALISTGCASETFDKSMEEGKLALASKEYEKASGLFSLALEEKENNQEAKELKEITEKLIEIDKLSAEGNLKGAINICNEIEKLDVQNNSILSELEKKKSELQENLNKIKNIEQNMVETETLIDNKKYKEAKEILNTLSIEAKENNLDDIVSKINSLLDECDNKIASEEETKKTLTPQIAIEILYQKVGTHLNYEFSGDLSNEYHVYGENGSNFYCFYASEDGMPLEGAYYVHKTTGKVYEAYSDGGIKEV